MDVGATLRSRCVRTRECRKKTKYKKPHKSIIFHDIIGQRHMCEGAQRIVMIFGIVSRYCQCNQSYYYQSIIILIGSGFGLRKFQSWGPPIGNRNGPYPVCCTNMHTHDYAVFPCELTGLKKTLVNICLYPMYKIPM